MATSRITGTTKLLGVLGYPIAHTLSPTMHNQAIAHLGLDYVYLPFPVRPQDLAIALQGLGVIGIQGLSLTIPHKQAILPHLATVDPVAQAVGAVNTVWPTPEGWAGTNTDVAGFLAPLLSMDRDWTQTTAVILGNGGAARAVVAACAQLGCQQIQVVGRNAAKLAAFHQSWLASPLPVRLTVQTWDQLPALLPQAQLLVNTTPIGMDPQTTASPVPASSLAKLAPGAIAYDLIYTPRPTRFLREAQHQGAIALDGLEMLVQQGAAALEIWLGRSAPLDVMRQAAQGGLAIREPA